MATLGGVVTAISCTERAETAEALDPVANVANVPSASPTAYMGRWAPSLQQCATEAWRIDRRRVVTPGGADCQVAEVEEANAAWGLDLTCRTPAGTKATRLTVALLDPTRADTITIQSSDFTNSETLTRCS